MRQGISQLLEQLVTEFRGHRNDFNSHTHSDDKNQLLTQEGLRQAHNDIKELKAVIAKKLDSKFFNIFLTVATLVITGMWAYIVQAQYYQNQRDEERTIRIYTALKETNDSIQKTNETVAGVKEVFDKLKFELDRN